MSKAKLNVAMIGSGFIANVHSNAFRQVGHFFDIPYDVGCKVICGRTPSKLEKTASRWGWNEIETDWQKIIARKDIDAVDIAVPNALHSAIAIAAAEAGKIVICEKPLASTLEEAERMTRAVQRTPNAVWFNYRRIPAVVFAKQLIDQGRIGQAFHYRALYLNQSGNDPSKGSTWRYKRNEAGMGAAGDLLSHCLDMALYLNGTITELAAMMHTFAPGRDVDDAALMLAPERLGRARGYAAPSGLDRPRRAGREIGAGERGETRRRAEKAAPGRLRRVGISRRHGVAFASMLVSSST